LAGGAVKDSRGSIKRSIKSVGGRLPDQREFVTVSTAIGIAIVTPLRRFLTWP
jgi:hypothetical protein